MYYMQPNSLKLDNEAMMKHQYRHCNDAVFIERYLTSQGLLSFFSTFILHHYS